MAGNVKGITIEFRGDTTSLDKALRKIKSESKDIDSQLKDVNKALKFNPHNTELLAQKQTLLKDRIKQTESNLKEFKEMQDKLDAQKVEKTSKEYMEVRRSIVEAESKLKHFQSEVDKLGNTKLTAFAGQLSELAGKIKPVGDALTKHITVPLAALGGASVGAGLEFDAAMSQVAATMGVSVDEIENLRVFAQEMGATTAFSATQAAEALNYMALAGYDADTSMAMLPVVLNLAAAGNMDLARTSDVVTDAQTALGLSIDDTVVLADQMAKTASKSNTSIKQLGDAMLTVGGTARGMRGGTEELVVVLGALADNGIKGSEGGTALRNMLLKLSDPTSKTAEALAKLGINAYDADGKFRDLRELFPEIAAGLDTLSEAERNDILGDMFNVRDISKANALLNTSVERWGELSAAVQDAGGSAQQMADTQLDNLKGDLTLLKSALEGAAIAISDVLSPMLRKLTDFLTMLVDKFNALSPETQEMIVKIGLFAAAIGPVILGISGGLSLVSKAITGVNKVMTGLSKGISLILAHPIIALIVGIVAAIIYLWNNSEAFRAFVLDAFEKIKTAFFAVRDAFGVAIDWLVAKWNALKAFFAGIPDWFRTLFNTAWENIKAAFANWVAFWSGLWDAVKNKFTSLGTSIASAISGAVKSGINGVISMIENTINNAVRLINGAIGLINKIPGVSIGTIGNVSLPRLAKGGVLYGAQTVIAGEAGPEAIIPLDKLFKQMDKMAEQISGGNTVINVYPSAGMDVNALAKEIEYRIIQNSKRRRMAWQ